MLQKTPFWTLQTESAPASAVLTDTALILENRYIRRVIDRNSGITCSITDGDGTEAVTAPLREGSVCIDGTEYLLTGDCDIRILDGNLTEKRFDYQQKSYNMVVCMDVHWCFRISIFQRI